MFLPPRLPVSPRDVASQCAARVRRRCAWLVTMLLLLTSWSTAARAGAPQDNIGSEHPQLDAADRDALSADERVAALEGRTISRVMVRDTPSRWSSTAETALLAPGQRFTAGAARRALRDLLSSGQFAQGYIDAQADGDEVAVHLVMTPRRMVATVRIVGGNLSGKATLEAAELGPDAELTEASFRVVAGAIRQFYRKFGYDAAGVTLSAADTDDPMRVVLTIHIEPGTQRLVSRRIFVIEPKLDRLVGDLKYKYAVASGDALVEDQLVRADTDLAERLHHNGFLRATVRHRVVRKGSDAFVYIYLETGPLYTFSFEGNRAFEAREIRAELGLDAGNLDGEAVSVAQLTKRFYQSRGYYDVRVDVVVKDGGAGSRKDVVVHIAEGRQVRVTERLLACLPTQAPEGLSADALGAEIDAILTQQLPGLPLVQAINPTPVDAVLSPGGSRAAPRQLAPAASYTREAYDKAISHLKQLLHSRGYLNAVVGPVSVLRAGCKPGQRAGVCLPLAMAPVKRPRCAVDVAHLPIAEPALDEALECRPNPKKGQHCAAEMRLYIPIQLGPKMQFYDVVFEGNRVKTSKQLLQLIDYKLGQPFSMLELDTARARLLRFYKNEGYAYATIQTEVERSPDRTRARARFIINERKQVLIRDYEVRGNRRTDTSLILKRLALCRDLAACSDEEKVYRQDLVRKSEEQIARLGVFSSVAVALEDADVPEERKNVIITVVEQGTQYFEPSVGFSTGEGFRVSVEYGHRNIGGRAVAATFRAAVGVLPTFLILDDEVRKNYEAAFKNDKNIERRIGLSLVVPEIGLGPEVDFVFDVLHVRDNQRDFGLERWTIIPRLSYRPTREWSLQLGLSAEFNTIELVNGDELEEFLRKNQNFRNLLKYPQGNSVAFGQRLDATWDRRDSALAATSGTLVTGSVEHVSAPHNIFNESPDDNGRVLNDQPSEFLRISGRVAGYVRLNDAGLALALSLAGGINVQLTDASQTYPDRFFFLGGFGSMRGWQLNSLVPQDVADRNATTGVDLETIVVRGGDLFINPRVELRIPITDAIGTAAFLDTGNLWSQDSAITSPLDLLRLRYGLGAGLRLSTPVGPIALDYGFNLAPRASEGIGALHFAVGLF